MTFQAAGDPLCKWLYHVAGYHSIALPNGVDVTLRLDGGFGWVMGFAVHDRVVARGIKVGSSASGDFDADLDAAKAAALDKAQRLVLDQASSMLQTADAISEIRTGVSGTRFGARRERMANEDE